MLSAVGQCLCLSQAGGNILGCCRSWKVLDFRIAFSRLGNSWNLVYVIESPGKSLKMTDLRPLLSIFHCCVLQCKGCVLNCFGHSLWLTIVTCDLQKGMLGVELFKIVHCCIRNSVMAAPCWLLPSDYYCNLKLKTHGKSSKKGSWGLW